MNYYEILKIPKTASDAEIKSSYKTLVKKYHPDLYVGDKSFAEQKIKQINEAYEILSDPKRKAEYDEYLNPIKAVENNYSNNKQSYNSNTQSYSKNVKKQNHVTTDSITWSISDFILKKFNKLNQKEQLQIFIGIIVFVLALFLINLIQFKQYLSNENHKNHYINNSQNIENENIKNTNTNYNYYVYSEEELFKYLFDQTLEEK